MRIIVRNKEYSLYVEESNPWIYKITIGPEPNNNIIVDDNALLGRSVTLITESFFYRERYRTFIKSLEFRAVYKYLKIKTLLELIYDFLIPKKLDICHDYSLDIYCFINPKGWLKQINQEDKYLINGRITLDITRITDFFLPKGHFSKELIRVSLIRTFVELYCNHCYVYFCKNCRCRRFKVCAISLSSGVKTVKFIFSVCEKSQNPPKDDPKLLEVVYVDNWFIQIPNSYDKKFTLMSNTKNKIDNQKEFLHSPIRLTEDTYIETIEDD